MESVRQVIENPEPLPNNNGFDVIPSHLLKVHHTPRSNHPEYLFLENDNGEWRFDITVNIEPFTWRNKEYRGAITLSIMHRNDQDEKIWIRTPVPLPANDITGSEEVLAWSWDMEKKLTDAVKEKGSKWLFMYMCKIINHNPLAGKQTDNIYTMFVNPDDTEFAWDIDVGERKLTSVDLWVDVDGALISLEFNHILPLWVTFAMGDYSHVDYYAKVSTEDAQKLFLDFDSEPCIMYSFNQTSGWISIVSSKNRLSVNPITWSV